MSSRIAFLRRALAANLAPMLQTAGGPCTQVATADAALTRFLNGAGGKFDLPLLAVGYAGSRSEPAATDRLWHKSVATLVVFVIIESRGGIDSELTTADVGLDDLVDRVIDLLAGKRIYKLDAAGAYLDDEGNVTTDPAEYVEIGHPLEIHGDEPAPLPPWADEHNLVAWAVTVSTDQTWQPNRDEVLSPEEFEKIAGAVGPHEVVESDDDTVTDSVGVLYDDPPTD
jgi:hypothetical protein